jgi:hypothetical protein
VNPQREAIEHALVQWGERREQVESERDPLVLGAIAIGISKNRVHVLTGIARTTVDRIAESAEGAD